MNIDEKINGWTFEETIKTAENLMEVEKNMFTWDVIRHLRDFAELYRDKLAEYENLEEQGRLVKLPCKVGGTLYRLVPKLYRKYVEIKIAQFVINKNGIYFITDKGVSWSADKIGKTVFLTKSEAEAKLKELRGGENEN